MNKVKQWMAVALAGLLLSGCAAADVIKKYSKTSFAAIVGAYPNLVQDEGNAYGISVDGDTRLVVSKDFGASEDDITMDVALAPFTAAGLDPAKLGVGYRVAGDRLELTADYGTGSGARGTVTDALEAAADAERKALSFHQKLDHFGFGLPAGKFEYAKDYRTNDKDIVFAIYADPLAQLGVNVENIEGWTYLTMEDEDGGTTNLLLKPYNLNK